MSEIMSTMTRNLRIGFLLNLLQEYDKNRTNQVPFIIKAINPVLQTQNMLSSIETKVM